MVYVLGVGTTVGEPLVALGTLEWLLSAVKSLVLRQMMFVFESLVTFSAFMWT